MMALEICPVSFECHIGKGQQQCVARLLFEKFQEDVERRDVKWSFHFAPSATGGFTLVVGLTSVLSGSMLVCRQRFVCLN
jgi:hypothetical protein